jgi:hypothetical protein
MPVELRASSRLTLSVVIRLLTGVIVAALLLASVTLATTAPAYADVSYGLECDVSILHYFKGQPLVPPHDRDGPEKVIIQFVGTDHFRYRGAMADTPIENGKKLGDLLLPMKVSTDVYILGEDESRDLTDYRLTNRALRVDRLTGELSGTHTSVYKKDNSVGEDRMTGHCSSIKVEPKL